MHGIEHGDLQRGTGKTGEQIRVHQMTVYDIRSDPFDLLPEFQEQKGIAFAGMEIFHADPCRAQLIGDRLFPGGRTQR